MARHLTGRNDGLKLSRYQTGAVQIVKHSKIIFTRMSQQTIQDGGVYPSTKLLHTHSACRSVCVLLDGDVSHRPGFSTVCSDQVASSTGERKGVRVVWIGGVHDYRRIDVVMLWNGTAFCLLAFHRCCKVWSATDFE